MQKVVTKNERETRALAGSLIGRANVYLLSGDLGAGKTAFIRGFCVACGVPEEDVHSPTFAIVNEYKAENGGKIFHFDAYRLTADDWFEGGFDEYLDKGICLIEWAGNLPKEVRGMSIKIEGSGEEPRCITIAD